MDDSFMMDFRPETNGAVTAGEALFAYLKREIVSGNAKPGMALPTIQKLAEMSGVTFRIARGAIERLAREGYVRSRPRVGTVVLPRDAHVMRGKVLFALPDVDASSYHVTQIADSLHRELGKAGYVFTTAVFSQNPRHDHSFIKCELDHAPDIVVSMYAKTHLRRYLAGKGIRCIYVYGEKPEENEGPWIRFSAEDAISVFVEHCVRKGVGKVVQVRFSGNETPDAESALSAAGISCAWKTIPRWDVLGRYEGIERAAFETFLNMPQEKFPDVFLFWDDFVAQGALTAFMKRGVSIPRDIKIAVLSNRGRGPVYTEPLTRFECDAAAAGEKIACFTLSMLAKGRVPTPPVISPQYVFGSTFPF